MLTCLRLVIIPEDCGLGNIRVTQIVGHGEKWWSQRGRRIRTFQYVVMLPENVMFLFKRIADIYIVVSILESVHGIGNDRQSAYYYTRSRGSRDVAYYIKIETKLH